MSAPLAHLKTAAETALAAQASAHAGDARARAAAHFAKAGLPHRRIEAWHYTDLRAKLRAAPLAAKRPDASAVAAARARVDALQTFGAARVVILDGWFVADLCDAMPEGATLSAQSEALPAMEVDDAMAALNAAAFGSGAFIDVSARADLARPIALVFLASPGVAAQARAHVRLGAGACAQILEMRDAGANALVNDAVDFDIGSGARLSHVALCADAPGLNEIVTLAATLGADARLSSLAVSQARGLARRQAFVRFDGAHAAIDLRGLSLLRGDAHVDNTLVVDHASVHCESREFFRHVVEGTATGVFQGKIIVRKGAQKTDGVMRSNALLLSGDAQMMNKPELEIFADDVVCGHGATVGELAEDQLFYLQARGLPRMEAEALLLEAFASETFDHLDEGPLREGLCAMVAAWLGARSKGGAA